MPKYNPSMWPYLIVGAGGFFGAMARFAVSGWLAARLGTRFPTGTLAVNVTGSFFLALLVSFVLERLLISPPWRLFWAVGFLGAYTTFSTFAWETNALMQESAWGLALGNVVANVVAGLVAVRIGVSLARVFM